MEGGGGIPRISPFCSDDKITKHLNLEAIVFKPIIKLFKFQTFHRIKHTILTKWQHIKNPCFCPDSEQKKWNTYITGYTRVYWRVILKPYPKGKDYFNFKTWKILNSWNFYWTNFASKNLANWVNCAKSVIVCG